MGSDWSQYRSSRDTTPRLIGSSFGEEGTGKSTFWLWGPAPVVVLSLDFGSPHVIDGVRKERGVEIVELEYPWSPTDDSTQEAAIELRDAFVRDYRYALKYARTVIIDKESQLYPLFTAAEWPEGYDPEPREWAPLQQRYRALINEAKTTDVNLGLVQGMKSPWEKPAGGKLAKTKERVRRGFAEIGELVFMNIEHYIEMLPGQDPSYQFMLRTGKLCGPGARQMQYREMPAVTFQEFGMLLFPDSSEADWV